MEISGRPANRSLSRTPTSVAKIAADAESMTDGSIVSAPTEPCGSTTTLTPAFVPAAANASAAM